MKTRSIHLVSIIIAISLVGAGLAGAHVAAEAQESRQPISAYFLDEAEAIALAKSAATAEVSEGATVLALKEHGYQRLHLPGAAILLQFQALGLAVGGG